MLHAGKGADEAFDVSALQFLSRVSSGGITCALLPPYFPGLRGTLTAVPEGTLVQWKSVFSDPVVAAAIRHIAEPANEQNLDRLSAALAAKSASVASRLTPPLVCRGA